MGRGDTSPAPDLGEPLRKEELPYSRPRSPEDTLLVIPGSQEAAAPEPGEDVHGTRRQESRCVKPWIQKYVVPIICFFLGGLIFFFSAVYLVPACPPVPPACPNKWTRSDEKCYFVSQAYKDWISSLDFCKSHGGTLLPPGNETQQAIGSLHNLVKEDYWIGLKKDVDSGEWKQLNGSVWPWPIKYDHPTIHCSCVNSGEYVALRCSTSRRWICIKSL